MSAMDIVRAWKDQDYRQSLTEAEQAFLPDNPAGILELSGSDRRNKGVIHLPRLDTLSLIFGELTLFLEPPR